MTKTQSLSSKNSQSNRGYRQRKAADMLQVLEYRYAHRKSLGVKGNSSEELVLEP